ncbi:conserved hypothetical protein [Roseovarius sp. EC-HK134]|uniref:hypothetical protein n=1 Tax=unclassified Roseovarius TaxID=2614913 RepID=UPI00125AA747|nr:MULTISPECIES: hypothetical protein [unclassified Roseovarius]VVT31494.1 conserved hypothetical protein [Roseovarius sp. EC-HK134]VVT31907.1 conserved hypothetical protein [Roseovarius sp. EC-SD190]
MSGFDTLTVCAPVADFAGARGARAGHLSPSQPSKRVPEAGLADTGLHLVIGRIFQEGEVVTNTYDTSASLSQEVCAL